MKSRLRTASVLTLICFFTSNIAWGVPIADVIPKSTPKFLQIQVPNELASIEEMYEAPPQIDSKLILHIQNVHGNFEAQNQIRKLLSYLDQSYGFKLLFVEGASEKLDPKYLKLFPDEENNKRLAESLAQNGALTGPELFMLDNPKNVEALGIEQTNLYRSNYEAFKTVYGQKDNSDLLLKHIEERVERLSSRFFSPDTRRIVAEWKKFEAGHRDFLPFVERLSKDANKFNGIDLSSLFAQAEWPQTTRLLALQQMEKELDRSKAEREKTKLVEFLKSIRISDKTIAEIDHLGERRITMSKTSAGSNEKESLPRYLLERLAKEASGKGFHFHDYPAFSLYAGYLILQSELDSRALFNEIEILFDKILAALTPSEREKNLLELFRDHDLLTKLLHLELSRKEWDRASYRKDWLIPSSIIRRINLIEEQAGGPASKPDDTIQGLFQSLPTTFETALNFYDFARKRETGFFQRMKDEMSLRGEDKAIVITGGFHADGIADLFREEGINYGVLLPRITQKIDNVNYVANMLEAQPTRFDLATIEMINTLEQLGTKTAMGADETAHFKILFDQYLNAARFRTSNDLRDSINHFNRFAEDYGTSVRMSLKQESKSVEISFPDGSSYSVPLRKLSDGSVGFTNTASKTAPPARQELRAFDESRIRSKFAAIDRHLGAYFDVAEPDMNFVRSPENGELRQTPIDALLKLIRHYRLDSVSDLKVLEIGTGTGVAAYAFAEIPNSHVTSIEVQPDRLQFANGARNYLEEHGISYSNVEFKPGNFLAYNTENFDVIYFYYTHPEDPAARRNFAKSVIEKLNKELKPGQRAIFLNFGHTGTPEAEEMENLNSGRNGAARISITRGKIAEGIVATEFKVKDTAQRPEMRTASDISRRNFLGLGAGLAAALMLPEIPSINAQSQPPQNRIAYNTLPASSRRLIAENMSRLIQIARTKNLTALSNAFKGWENKLYVVQGSDREGDLHGGGEASLQGVYLDEGMLNWVLNSPNDPAATYIFIRTLLHEFVHHEHAKSGSAKNRTREQEENITRLETAFFFGDSIYTSYNGVLGPSGTVRPAPNQKFFNDKNELIAYEDGKNVVFSVFLVKDASGKVQFFKSPDGIEMPAIYLNAYPDQLPERLINQAKIKELEAVLKSGTQNQTDTEKIQKEITRLRGLIANLLPRLLTPEVQAQGNKITALFPETGRYVIQSTPNLRWWTNVTNEILIVEPGQKTFSLPNQNQMNLYRVAYLGRSEMRTNLFMGVVAKYASILLLSLGFNEISFSQAQTANRGPVIENIIRQNNQTTLTVMFDEPGGYSIEASQDLITWESIQTNFIGSPGRTLIATAQRKPQEGISEASHYFFRLKKDYPWIPNNAEVNLGGITDHTSYSQLREEMSRVPWIGANLTDAQLMEAIEFSKQQLPLIKEVSKTLINEGILQPSIQGDWFPTLFISGIPNGVATAFPNLGLTIMGKEEFQSHGIEEQRVLLLFGIGHEQTHTQDYQANPNIAPLESENNAFLATWKAAMLAKIGENAISAQKMVSDAFQALIDKQKTESFVTALFELPPDKFNQINYNSISLTGFDSDPRIQIRLYTIITDQGMNLLMVRTVEFRPKEGTLDNVTGRLELRQDRETEKSQRLIKAFTDMAASAIAIKPSTRNNFSADYSYKTEITDDPSTGRKKIKVSYLFSSAGSEPIVVGESNMTLVGLETPEPKIVSYGTNIEDPQHQGRGLKSSLNSDLREKLAGLKILFETAIDNNLTLLRIHRLLAAKIEGQGRFAELREKMLRLDETYAGIDANKALAGGTFLSAEDQISVLSDIKALYDLGIELTSDELGEMKPVGELGKELGPYQEIQPVIMNETTDPQVVINHFIWIGETQKTAESPRAELRANDLSNLWASELVGIALELDLMKHQPIPGFQSSYNFNWQGSDLAEVEDNLRKTVRQKAAEKTGADELLEFIHMIGDPQDQTFTELQELSRTTDQNPILVILIRDIVETAMASPAIEEWDKEDILKNAFSAQFALGVSVITENTEDVDNPTPWSRELRAWLNSIALRDFGQPIKDLMVSKTEINAMELLIRIKTEGTKYEVRDFEAGTTLEDFLKSKLDDSNPDWTKIDIVIGNRRVSLANAKTLKTPLPAGAQVYVLKRAELRQVSSIENIPGMPSLGDVRLSSLAVEAALEADGRFDYLVATMTSRGVLEIRSSLENIEAFAKTAAAANQNPVTDILEAASQALLSTLTPPESKTLEPGKSIVLLLPKQREKDGGISPKTMLEQFLRVVQAYNVETAHIAGHIPQRIPGEVMSRVAPVTLSGLTRLTAASGQATYPTVLGVDAAALSADLPADLIPVEMTNVESLATEESKAYAALLQSVIAAHIARITSGRKIAMNSSELKSELLKAIQLDEKFLDMVEVGSANNRLSVSISGVVTQAYLTHLASEKAKQAA